MAGSIVLRPIRLMIGVVAKPGLRLGLELPYPARRSTRTGVQVGGRALQRASPPVDDSRAHPKAAGIPRVAPWGTSHAEAGRRASAPLLFLGNERLGLGSAA